MDDQRTNFVDHDLNALIKTVSIMLKNEIELGKMVVTGRQSVTGFLSVAHVITWLEDSPLRDGVDWLVSKLCSGEVYYHFNCQYYSFSFGLNAIISSIHDTDMQLKYNQVKKVKTESSGVL